MTGELRGRRVAAWDECSEPGDYFPVIEDGALVALWFMDPSGSLGRIPSKLSTEGEPRWDIAIEGDLVTVDPSINRHPSGPDDKGWHGFLRAGVWSNA